MAHTRDLTTGSIPGHFRALAVPSAIGMVFTTLYNVVDVYFAGMISSDAQAGLTAAFQVFMVLIILGFGLGAGLSALIGNALGKGDADGAGEFAEQGLLLAVLGSLAVIALGYAFAPMVLEFNSQPGGYRDAAIGYVSVLMLGAPLFIVAQAANGILTAQGDTTSMQRAQIGSFFANLVLNPVFIFGIPGVWDGIGFNGIALSTIVSQGGTMAYILWKVWRSEVMQGRRWVWVPDSVTQGAIAVQAVPIAFAMAVMILAGIVILFFAKDFGEAGVAGWGVGLRIEQLLLLPAFGLTNALLPIAAQNIGAGAFDRVREAAFFCFKASVGLMLCAAVLIWFGAGTAMSVFTDDPEVIAVGKSYLFVDAFILPVYVLLFGINSFLQAMKKSLLTLVISVYRQGFGVFVFCWLFVRVLDFGIWGIWIGIGTAVLTGFVLSLYLMERAARQTIGGLFTRVPMANPDK